jgi:hypothetical protein
MRKVIALCLLLAVGCVPDSGTYHVTVEKYNKIEVGMSYNEVRRIVGVHGEELSRTDGGRMICWKNSDGSNMTVIFINELVHTKAQYGLAEASVKAEEQARVRAKAEAEARAEREAKEKVEAEARARAKAEAEAKARAEAEAARIREKAERILAEARKAIEGQPAKQFGDVDLLTDTVKPEPLPADKQRLSGTVINTRSHLPIKVVVRVAMFNGATNKMEEVERVVLRLRPGESGKFISGVYSSFFKLGVAGIDVTAE